MADEEFMFGDLFATVRVQDLPASREVVAVERQENGTWRVCGSAIANTDGIAELGIEGSKTSRVYAFAIDHWGEPFTPNKTVAYGDIIRPSVFLGWLYRVTAPGVLPGEEPVWWNSTPGMPRPVGSAMAQAEMYFQPIAHGPVDIEWEVKEEGDPHWDKVVALLHFDDTVGDVLGNVWEINSGGISYTGGRFEKAIDLTTQWLYTPYNTWNNFSYGSGDFTIEMWVCRMGDFTDGAIFNHGYLSSVPFCILAGWNNTYSHKNRLGIGQYGGGWLTAMGSAEIPLGQWVHVAATREGIMYRLYVDGKLDALYESNQPIVTNQPLLLGKRFNDAGQSKVPLLIDELRITKGVARYTENFIPPTEPFPNFK